MTHTKSNRNRVIASVASFILILALLLTGTFAFVIPMQHRTNIFEGEGIQFDATLFDHFREADAVNWRRGETIDKTIYVVNTGENPTSHGPVFVRISLREFMELIPTLVFYWGVAANGDLFQVPHANMFGSSTSRDVDAALFMVETGSGAGNTSHVFVHIPSSVYDYDADEADVLAALQVIRPDITAQHELVFTTDFVSGVEGWFVISREGDIHGQYGRYMVADVTLDTNPANTTLVGSNTPRATNQQFGIHGTNGECNYDVHLWHNAVLTAVVNQLRVGGNLPASYTAQYRAWIQWLLGGRVVLLSEWENMTPAERLAAETTVVTAPAEHSQAPIGAGVWIIDDRSPTATPASASGVNGWIYWSRQLEVGYRTANFLENVTLLEQPSGAFNYKIHVTMEGVSRSALWPEWPLRPPVGQPEVEEFAVGFYRWYRIVHDWVEDGQGEWLPIYTEEWYFVSAYPHFTVREDGYLDSSLPVIEVPVYEKDYEIITPFIIYRSVWDYNYDGTEMRLRGIVDGNNLSSSETIWEVVYESVYYTWDVDFEYPISNYINVIHTGEYFEFAFPDQAVGFVTIHARPADAPDNDDLLRIIHVVVWNHPE